MKQRIHILLGLTGTLLTACHDANPGAGPFSDTGTAFIAATRAEDEEDFEGFQAVLQRFDDDTQTYIEMRRYEGDAIASQLQGQTLTLLGGSYRLQLYNNAYDATLSDTLMTAVSYYGDQTFLIENGERTAVDAIVSRRTHQAVTVTCAPEVASHFTGTLTLTDTGSSLTWTTPIPFDGDQRICFPVTARLHYAVSLTNADGETFTSESDALQHTEGRNLLLRVTLSLDPD